MVRATMNDTLLVEVRFEQDETRASPGRLVGTLLTYGERAGDRPELFVRGALEWPPGGIVINEMHVRQAPILRAVPFLDGDKVQVDQPFPNTQRGRDAATNLREGVYTGLSVEFGALAEGRRGNVREIRRAVLTGGALVDRPAYTSSTAEVRQRAGRKRIWL